MTLEEAWQLLRDGQYREVLQIGMEELKDDDSPDYWWAVVGAATAYLDYDAKPDPLFQAEVHAEDHWMTHLGFCVRYFRSGFGGKMGQERAEKLVEKRPDISEGYIFQAFFLAEQDKTEKAFVLYKQGLSLRDRKPWYDGVEAFIALKKGDIDIALLSAELGYKQGTDTSFCALMFGMVLLKQKKYDKAIEIADAILEVETDYKKAKLVRVEEAYRQMKVFNATLGFYESLTSNTAKRLVNGFFILIYWVPLVGYFIYQFFEEPISWVGNAIFLAAMVLVSWHILASSRPFWLRDQGAKKHLTSTWVRDILMFWLYDLALTLAIVFSLVDFNLWWWIPFVVVFVPYIVIKEEVKPKRPGVEVGLSMEGRLRL